MTVGQIVAWVLVYVRQGFDAAVDFMVHNDIVYYLGKYLGGYFHLIGRISFEWYVGVAIAVMALSVVVRSVLEGDDSQSGWALIDAVAWPIMVPYRLAQIAFIFLMGMTVKREFLCMGVILVCIVGMYSVADHRSWIMGVLGIIAVSAASVIGFSIAEILGKRQDARRAK